MNRLLHARALLILTAMLALPACDSDDGGGGTGPVAGDSFVLTSGNKLVAFNFGIPSDTRTVAITGLPAGETLVGWDIRPADGLLYALSKVGTTGAKLYTVNTTTGALTAAAASTLTNATGGTAITLTGSRFGVDFNPVADRLRVVGDDGQNLRINVTAAASNTTVDAPVNTGLLEAAYTNSFSTSCQTDLFYLSGSQLLLSAAPNGVPGNASSGRFVGNLGQTATAAAFDVRTIATGANRLEAVLATAAGTALYTVDAATGAATNAGTLTLAAGETPLALASALAASAPALAVGNTVAITAAAPQKLVSFNRPPSGSPARLCSSNAISGVVAGETIIGADTRPADGKIYVLTKNGTAGKLYTLGLDGAATAVAALAADPADTSAAFTGLAGASFGVDFNPVPDRLRVVSDTGENLRINVANGLTTTDELLNVAGATQSGITAAAYTNSVNDGGTAQASLTTTLYAVNSATDQLVLIGANPADGSTCTGGAAEGNPNCGDVSAPLALGQDIGAVNAFEIDPRGGTALLAGTVGSTTSLFTVNLATGAATAVGNFTEPVVAMTGNGAASATVFGVTTTNKLVSFAPDTPGTVAALGTISVPAGVTVRGLDFRPSVGGKNNQLVAVGSDGKLYAVNPSTAAATLIFELNGTGLVFNGAVEQGVDFNPVPDRLRIVNEAGQNLRVNSDTGATTIDAPLTGATANGVFGAAYTNSFSATSGTALFYLVDGLGNANSTLATTADPNMGMLTAVGSLGADFSKIGDLDIVAGQNGFALAALQPAVGGESGLYRINLATGAATLIGTTIDTVGDEALRGIAVRLQ